MRLRVQHVIVQPVLVWDDGDELTAGPVIEAQALPLSKLPAFVESISAEVAAVEAQLMQPGHPVAGAPGGVGSRFSAGE